MQRLKSEATARDKELLDTAAEAGDIPLEASEEVVAAAETDAPTQGGQEADL